MGNLMEPTQWQALRLRATTFLLAESEIDSSSIWNTVIGGVPDDEQRRPKEGLLQQVGTLADLTAVMRMAHPQGRFLPSTNDPESGHALHISRLASLFLQRCITDYF